MHIRCKNKSQKCKICKNTKRALEIPFPTKPKTQNPPFFDKTETNNRPIFDKTETNLSANCVQIFGFSMKKGVTSFCNSLIFNRRGKRIRTFDPLLPKQVR